MKIFYKRLCLFLIVLAALLPTVSIGVYADDGAQNPDSGYIPDDTTRLVDDSYDGGSFSGYIPDDEKRLTDDFDDEDDAAAPTEKNPIFLTDEQKQQIEAMMEVAKWYASDDSVGNPVAPPYDEAYTKEMGEISDRIMDYGNSLLYDRGDAAEFNTVNSDYARLLTLLDNPLINARFAAYTCYLSFKEHNNNHWYDEAEWEQFVTYRNALYDVLTGIEEDYLHIEGIYLTYVQKKEVTDAFFRLLELYDTMTLDNAKSGDVDGDGDATILDVTVIQRYLAEMTELTEGQKLRATVRANASDNGPDVDITSVTALQRHLAGLDRYLPKLDMTEFAAFQTYNFPASEIRPTRDRYPDPVVYSQQKYRNVSRWNPILCITKYSDIRLDEIEAL
ncbi:MAG: dockerin type I repeat-containing protein [Ruminococcus sp.]|nr:dockerin type I repeat-containing protein [Ruminococcus sp.]